MDLLTLYPPESAPRWRPHRESSGHGSGYAAVYLHGPCAGR